MAQLDREIASIRTARYGREVRGAIAKSIEEINKDYNNTENIRREVRETKEHIESEITGVRGQIDTFTQKINENNQAIATTTTKIEEVKKLINNPKLQNLEIDKLLGMTNYKENLDKLFDAGFYSLSSGTTGIPSGTSSYGALMVLKGDGSTRKGEQTDSIQVFFDRGKDEVWMRNSVDKNNSWTSWKRVGSEVVNNLTSGGSDKALSAEQGKELKRLVDQAFQSASEGKRKIAEALTGKGVTGVSSNSTFQQMADGIKGIRTHANNFGIRKVSELKQGNLVRFHTMADGLDYYSPLVPWTSSNGYLYDIKKNTYTGIVTKATGQEEYRYKDGKYYLLNTANNFLDIYDEAMNWGRVKNVLCKNSSLARHGIAVWGDNLIGLGQNALYFQNLNSNGEFTHYANNVKMMQRSSIPVVWRVVDNVLLLLDRTGVLECYDLQGKKTLVEFRNTSKLVEDKSGDLTDGKVFKMNALMAKIGKEISSGNLQFPFELREWVNYDCVLSDAGIAVAINSDGYTSIRDSEGFGVLKFFPERGNGVPEPLGNNTRNALVSAQRKIYQLFSNSYDSKLTEYEITGDYI